MKAADAKALRAVLDEMTDASSRSCYCDEPPYAPEPGETGQAECPDCQHRRWVKEIRAALGRCP